MTDLTARLSGRCAVITGGASGIGLATARRFAQEGANVVIGDIDPVSGEKAAAEVGGLFVQVDVTDEAAVQNLFATAKQTYGSVDIAFNNAGIAPDDDNSILETGIEAWEKVQRVNLTSVYLCCKAAIPYMQEQGKGSIINTASFVAVMGAATSQISYSASNGGVLSMTRELGVEFARQGIRINALCPGAVKTPMLARAVERDPSSEKKLKAAHPMKRFAETAEIANAALWLASEQASYVNGHEMVVDGGFTAI